MFDVTRYNGKNNVKLLMKYVVVPVVALIILQPFAVVFSVLKRVLSTHCI